MEKFLSRSFQPVSDLTLCFDQTTGGLIKNMEIREHSPREKFFIICAKGKDEQKRQFDIN